MIAILFQLLLIICCLCMLTLKRELKPAIFLFAYAVLSEVSVPLPFGNTVFFLPMFYIFTEGLKFKDMIKSFHIRELVLALLVYLILFLYTYADSPHYWGSVRQFITLLFREGITTYFILVVGFYSVKSEKTFRPLLRIATISLFILTVFGLINYITKESTMLDWMTGHAVKRNMGVGGLFSDEERFRTQSLFIQPFDYGYMCVILLLVHVYGYTRRLVGKQRLTLVFLMALFGIVTCGCRTVLFCFVFGSFTYAILYLRGNRLPIYIGAALLVGVGLYQVSPYFREKAGFVLSIFSRDNSEYGGSTIEMRAIQTARVFIYLDGYYLTGRGYDYFWIDLQFSEGQQNALDPELLGLEGVHLKYLLERGFIGYGLYLLFYILLISYLYRHRKSNKEEAAAALALLVVYLTFAHMTGELKSLPPTLLILGMFLRMIQNESWKYVQSQQKKFDEKYRNRYRQLS